MSEDVIDRLAEKSGILSSFRDLAGIEHITNSDSKRALLRANGFNADNDAVMRDQLEEWDARNASRHLPERIILDAECIAPLPLSSNSVWRLTLEDGGLREGRGPDLVSTSPLPLGLHRIEVQVDKVWQSTLLIVAPRAAPTIAEATGRERVWGVNLALYGLHSAGTSGLGDYRDLEGAIRAVGGAGAYYLGINPIHAMGWQTADISSPYSPSHRAFLNSNHLALDTIKPTVNASSLNSASMVQNQTDLIDYATHAHHHRGALEALYIDFCEKADQDMCAAFDDFCWEQGEALQRFASFEAQHGTSRSGDDPTFHCWLQWQADRQLRRTQQTAKQSGMALGLYLDLAVGARRDGAEAHIESGSIAQGVSIGAPPDRLSPAGQNWNLTGFAPSKLALTDFRAFRTILASNMKRCGLLRIDHILGLNRSYWIPDDGSPGAYIRQDFEALLAIIRLEARRHNTVVIGEDLGLVPDGFRDALRDSGLYSFSVLQYERGVDDRFIAGETLRPQSLACFGTHDTPTLQGFAQGRDIDWWEKLGWTDRDGARQARSRRRQDARHLCAMAPVNDWAKGVLDPLSCSVHTTLAASPAAMVSVQWDDVEEQSEAQNLPGTVDEHPNWRRRYQARVEDMSRDERLLAISNIMANHGRSRTDESS
ncbi:MAG: 4-alpha-glucanotransferase [Ahrensia sp.]|nr:4-alpha-glucanotransferase [Ahrensia sp.]